MFTDKFQTCAGRIFSSDCGSSGGLDLGSEETSWFPCRVGKEIAQLPGQQALDVVGDSSGGNRSVCENKDNKGTMYLLGKRNRFLNNTGNERKRIWGIYKNNKAEGKR